MSWKDEDPRAVIDPYASTFDLAEEFLRNIHRLRRMNASVLIFMSTWICLLVSAISFVFFTKWGALEIFGLIIESILLWVAIFLIIFHYRITQIIGEFGRRHSIVSEVRRERMVAEREAHMPVEGNPIKRIKEFVDDVNAHASYLKNLVHIVKISIFSFIIVIIIDLIGSFITGESFLWYGALNKWDILTAFSAVSLLTLWTFYEVQSGENFVSFINKRWEAIRTLEKLPDIIKVPAGKTPQQRFMRYLSSSDLGDFVDSSAVKHGASFEFNGKKFSFHIIFTKSVKHPLARIYLWPRAESIYVRISAKKPMKKTIEKLIDDVKIVLKERALFPKRIFYIWKIPEGTEEFKMDIDDSLYDFIASKHSFFKWGMRQERVAVQIVFERPDGTYDFIPHVFGEG